MSKKTIGAFNPVSAIANIGGAAAGLLSPLGLNAGLLGGGGLEGTPSQSTTAPFFNSTAYSTTANGQVNIDPSVRSLQNQGITSLNQGQQALGQAVGQFGTNLGQLRQSLLGNQGAFMQARTRPMETLFSQQRGQLAQDFGRRGLSGSSFASQAQTRQAVDQTQALADQRSLAAQESIQAGLSIDQMLLQASQLEAQGNRAQADYLRSIANDRANLEASLLTASGTNSTGRQPGLLEQFNVSIPVGG